LFDFHTFQVYRKNNERIMKKSEALYKKMNSAELDRVCIEQGAERICDLRTVDGIRFCYFHCMFTREGVGHLDSFYRFFYFMFDDFCKPFRTNYQSLFSTKSGRDSFKSYKKFQNLLDMDEKNLKTLIYQFSNAILGSIIQYTETPYKALRPIFTRIEKALIDQFPNNTHNVFENNPDCILIKPLLAYESFGQGLKSDSAIENLMLPGFFLLNTIAKYINAKVSLRYTALMEINRYVSGNSSGFGCASWSKDIKGYNESIDIEEDIHHGKSPKGICDDLGRPPAMGFPIPPVANDQLHYATISKIIMCTDSSPSNDAS